MSNRIKSSVEMLILLNTDTGRKLISDLQNKLSDISIEDGEEIMAHVYSGFFYKGIKEMSK